MGRINEFLRLPVEFPEHGAEPIAGRTGQGRDASGAYPGGAAPGGPRPRLLLRGDGRGEALRGVSFSVRKGRCSGWWGRPAAGRARSSACSPDSTLPRPERSSSRGSTRRRSRFPIGDAAFAVVSQDPFLFSDSVLENVCFGRERTDPEAAEEGDRLGPFPRRGRGDAERLSTPSWESGDLAVGGQKQRAPSPVRFAPMRRSCCWMTPSPPWTPRRSGRSSRNPPRRRGSGRSCSARTGWPPSPGAIGSWLLADAGSPRRGRTTTFSPCAAPTSTCTPARCSPGAEESS